MIRSYSNRLITFLRNVSAKQFHVSWLIAWLAIGVLIGTAIIPQLEYVSFHRMSWLLLSAGLVMVGFFKRSVFSIVIVAMGGIGIGFYNGAQQLIAYKPITMLHSSNEHRMVTGRVIDDTTRNNRNDQRIQLTDLVIDDSAYAGNIWINTSAQTPIKRGDRVTVEGQLSEGFGVMQASMFRAQVTEIVRPDPGDIARQARDSFASNIHGLMESAQANLGVSFLVGQRSALPADMQDMFRDVGLIHLVVASGFHLTLVVRFGRTLFAKQSKYLATLTSFTLIFGFLLLTGFSTSMIRASLVTGASLLAWYFGRAIHPFVLLPVVASLTVLARPLFLWADLAWYLSFAAFGGVIILAPLLHRYFWHPEKEPGFFRYLIVATFSAQLLTFPIIALTFEQYSLLAILANVLVLPVVPVVMLGTFLAGIVSYGVPAIAQVIASITQLGIDYVIAVVEYLAAHPLATQTITINAWHIWTFYGILSLIIWYLARATKYTFRHNQTVI